MNHQLVKGTSPLKAETFPQNSNQFSTSSAFKTSIFRHNDSDKE
jgi:hypothetical protein